MASPISAPSSAASEAAANIGGKTGRKSNGDRTEALKRFQPGVQPVRRVPAHLPAIRQERPPSGSPRPPHTVVFVCHSSRDFGRQRPFPAVPLLSRPSGFLTEIFPGRPTEIPSHPPARSCGNLTDPDKALEHGNHHAPSQHHRNHLPRLSRTRASRQSDSPAHLPGNAHLMNGHLREERPS